MTNRPAVINASVLAVTYIFLIGVRMGWLGKDFDIIFLPILALGFIAESWFVIKSLIKKRSSC